MFCVSYHYDFCEVVYFFFVLMILLPPRSTRTDTLVPYTTLFRSEVEEFAAQMGKARIDPIFLLATTSTDERIQKIAQVARGYVYYVSLKGVTGAGNLDTADVAESLTQVTCSVSIQVGVGFAIPDDSSEKHLALCGGAVRIGWT